MVRYKDRRALLQLRMPLPYDRTEMHHRQPDRLSFLPEKIQTVHAKNPRVVLHRLDARARINV